MHYKWKYIDNKKEGGYHGDHHHPLNNVGDTILGRIAVSFPMKILFFFLLWKGPPKFKRIGREWTKVSLTYDKVASSLPLVG
jgi:hypothetical protein